jgi:hypothetical protein
MIEQPKLYTTQLQAGLGVVDETQTLLDLYEEGMTALQLYEVALDSGAFPMVSARRLRNIVSECFAPRFIKSDSAKYLKTLKNSLSLDSMTQFFLIHTAAANRVFHDFLSEVYWERYSGGRSSLSLQDAKDFVENAVREGKTTKVWSETTMTRVSSYVLGCCVDFGMVSSKRTRERNIQPIRIQSSTVAYLAYFLHFSGLGDNGVINHEHWSLFGLEPSDVREEFKRLALNGWVIFQAAGDVVKIGWNYDSMDEVIDVIAQG